VPEELTWFVVVKAVVDAVKPDISVYNANLKLLPPLAKLCVPDKSSVLKDVGITFAIYFLLLLRCW